MTVERLGIVDSARDLARRFAERHPAIRRRIMGLGPDVSNAKETHITVDCRTGKRTFARIVPPPKVDKPRPVVVPFSPSPGSKFHDQWHTPEGRRKLAMLEGIDAPVSTIRVGDIMRAVSEASGISVAQLCGVSREKKYAHPRHIAMLLVGEFRPDLSLPKVGFLFGNRDHTTVMHGQHESRIRIEKSQTHRDWYDAARAIIEARQREAA